MHQHHLFPYFPFKTCSLSIIVQLLDMMSFEHFRHPPCLLPCCVHRLTPVSSSSCFCLSTFRRPAMIYYCRTEEKCDPAFSLAMHQLLTFVSPFPDPNTSSARQPKHKFGSINYIHVGVSESGVSQPTKSSCELLASISFPISVFPLLVPSH